MLSKVLPKSQILFRVAQPKDKKKIFRFLDNHFAKEEPCARSLKLTPETSRGIFLTTTTRCLNFPFSTVVHQENGDIIGCLLASVWNRNDPIENADLDAAGFLNNSHANFWKVAPPHINSVIHREIGSVAPEFTRRGIATRMVYTNMTKSKLKKYNISGVISETSSLSNQIVLEKAGLRCLKEFPYSTIIDSSGEQILNLDDGTTSLRLNFRGIEEYEHLPEY